MQWTSSKTQSLVKVRIMDNLFLPLQEFFVNSFHFFSAAPVTFSLHARKTTLKLTAKSAEEADEWIVALQDVSIRQFEFETPFQI